MIRSHYCCCCSIINEPVIFSHCVHRKRGSTSHLYSSQTTCRTPIPCPVESLKWSWWYCPFKLWCNHSMNCSRCKLMNRIQNANRRWLTQCMMKSHRPVSGAFCDKTTAIAFLKIKGSRGIVCVWWSSHVYSAGLISSMTIHSFIYNNYAFTQLTATVRFLYSMLNAGTRHGDTFYNDGPFMLKISYSLEWLNKWLNL